jgi:CRP-like cAMP-binding protein
MSGVGFFVIVDGTATVSVGGSEVALLGPGDHFGELALISERVRSATVRADGPLHCLVMPFWDFRQFAKQNPDVTWKLLQHLVELLTEERSKRAQATLQAS